MAKKKGGKKGKSLGVPIVVEFQNKYGIVEKKVFSESDHGEAFREKAAAFAEKREKQAADFVRKHREFGVS